MKTIIRSLAVATAGTALFTATALHAQETTNLTANASAADDAAELAKKLSNPVAALISVPLQNNFDFGGGPKGQGFRYTLNIQPVVPISLS